eukprot:scaffold703_cov168-Amphora_coffeaeformis.AAC.29
MKLIATILLSIVCLSTAFQVQPRTANGVGFSKSHADTTTSLNGFLGEPEREKLSRDSEPDEFFAT